MTNGARPKSWGALISRVLLPWLHVIVAAALLLKGVGPAVLFGGTWGIAVALVCLPVLLGVELGVTRWLERERRPWGRRWWLGGRLAWWASVFAVVLYFGLEPGGNAGLAYQAPYFFEFVLLSISTRPYLSVVAAILIVTTYAVVFVTLGHGRLVTTVLIPGALLWLNVHAFFMGSFDHVGRDEIEAQPDVTLLKDRAQLAPPPNAPFSLCPKAVVPDGRGTLWLSFHCRLSIDHPKGVVAYHLEDGTTRLGPSHRTEWIAWDARRQRLYATNSEFGPHDPTLAVGLTDELSIFPMSDTALPEPYQWMDPPVFVSYDETLDTLSVGMDFYPLVIQYQVAEGELRYRDLGSHPHVYPKSMILETVYVPSRKVLYATLFFGPGSFGRLLELDPETLEIRRSVANDDVATTVVIDEALGRAILPGYLMGRAAVVDLDRLTVLRVLETDRGIRRARLDAQRGLVFLLSWSSGNLVALDRETYQEVNRWFVGRKGEDFALVEDSIFATTLEGLVRVDLSDVVPTPGATR